MASLDGSTGGRAVEGGYSTSVKYHLEALGDFADFAGDFGGVDWRIATCVVRGLGRVRGPRRVGMHVQRAAPRSCRACTVCD